MTIRRFPQTDPEALEDAYPEVKYSEVVRFDRAKGNTRNAHVDAPKIVGRGRDRRNYPKGPNS